MSLSKHKSHNYTFFVNSLSFALLHTEKLAFQCATLLCWEEGLGISLCGDFWTICLVCRSLEKRKIIIKLSLITFFSISLLLLNYKQKMSLSKTQKPQVYYCPNGLMVKLSVSQAETIYTHRFESR